MSSARNAGSSNLNPNIYVPIPAEVQRCSEPFLDWGAGNHGRWRRRRRQQAQGALCCGSSAGVHHGDGFAAAGHDVCGPAAPPHSRRRQRPQQDLRPPRRLRTQGQSKKLASDAERDAGDRGAGQGPDTSVPLRPRQLPPGLPPVAPQHLRPALSSWSTDAACSPVATQKLSLVSLSQWRSLCGDRFRRNESSWVGFGAVIDSCVI
mmetsp:Transcript_28136/g.56768  ORF Transcript_28136/g.56768 Transcript_28136/m.56768 type:complete len:206 (-) Transcript_28136:156-773(-)